MVRGVPQATSRNLARGCLDSATHQIHERDRIRRFLVAAPCHVSVRTEQHEPMCIKRWRIARIDLDDFHRNPALGRRVDDA